MRVSVVLIRECTRDGIQDEDEDEGGRDDDDEMVGSPAPEPNVLLGMSEKATSLRHLFMSSFVPRAASL